MRFISPVKVGARVRMTAVIAEVTEIAGGYQLDRRPDDRDRGRHQARRRRARPVPLLRLTRRSDMPLQRTRTTDARRRARRCTTTDSAPGWPSGASSRPTRPRSSMATVDDVTYRQLADGTDGVSALLWHRGDPQGRSRRVPGREQPRVPAGALRRARSSAPSSCPINTRLAAAGDRSTCSTDSGARVLIHDPRLLARVGSPPRSSRTCITTGEAPTRCSGLAAAPRSTRRSRRCRRHPRRPRRDPLHLGHDRQGEGRRAHPREPHLGRAQLPGRLRHRLDRRRPDDLAALPRRVPRHGRAPDHPEGRDDRAREGLRTRRGRSSSSSGTA